MMDWTQQDISFLIDNYTKLSLKDLGVALNRSPQAIFKKATRLNLIKNNRILKPAYDKHVITIIQQSVSYSDVLRKTNNSISGASLRVLKKYIVENNIDISHFKARGTFNSRTKKISEWLKHGTIIGSNSLKIKLYKHNLKKEQCELCGQEPIWMGKKMALILDHIDGDNTNNIIENLRIVCPNCNATLPTHCGKNRKTKCKKSV